MTRSVSPLPLLGGLYTVQGAVFGFTTNLLVPFLAVHQVSLEAQTGLLALASFPWVFKLPIAIALDRLRVGAAKVAGVAMLGAGALLVMLAGFGDALPTFAGLALAWFGINVLLAGQDISADALAIDAVPEERRGRANGVMWIAHTLGAAVVGTMGLGALLTRFGVGAALGGLAIVSVLGGVWALRARIPVVLSTAKGGLAEVLRAPSTWLLGGLASVFLIANVGTSALSGAFFVQRLAWPFERLTTTLPIVVLVGQVVGYGTAAALVDRIGHARSAALGSALLGAAWAGFGALEFAWSSVELLYGFVVVESVATALLFVGLYAWLMDRVNPRFRATQYAVFMSLLNLPRVWVPGFAPDALEALGWSGLFIAAGAFQIVLGALAWLVGRRGQTPGPTSV